VHRLDYDYELPDDLIAQAPLAERSASRLLVLEGTTGALCDRVVRELPDLLESGDLLVMNDTRVIAARLLGVKPTGGRVEILLERELEGDEALVQLSASKAIQPGLVISTAGGPVSVLKAERDFWRVRLPQPALPFLERWGEVPLPPYIRRDAGHSDRERYQSVMARVTGAVAAPTASLHFDAALLAELERRGVRRTCITLHVGAGTFKPVRTEKLEEHVMHAERVHVGQDACDAIERTRGSGKRVVAVGTTVVRALESASREGGGALAPWSGETTLFIREGFEFRVVDALLTNFHLPQSTLLMLVSAFAGRRHVLKAYAHAVRAHYRFFSYGDAMLATPQHPRALDHAANV
jgi:S-adenosylmethionine:tRNA ribosyltransferase-isomerase